jgi:hypothetical protein
MVSSRRPHSPELAADRGDDVGTAATRHTPRPRPSVIPDIGPDGRPQVMLVTPSTATVLTRVEACDLLRDLLMAID